MPIETLAHHPAVIGMNGAAFGHLMRLALHFWLTDCKPLPVVDNQLYVLARAYPATWKANRVEIKAVLQDVIPELKAARTRWEKRVSVLDHLRGRAVESKRRKRLEKSIEPPSSIGKTYRPRTAERNREQEAGAKQGGFVDKL